MAKRCDGKLVIPCTDCKDHMDNLTELKSDYNITMAEIRKDLQYIKEKLDSNSIMIQNVIDNKADKEEVKDLKDKFKNVMITVGSAALAIIGYLVIKWVENRP